jgi:Fe-S oxidoreductase
MVSLPPPYTSPSEILRFLRYEMLKHGWLPESLEDLRHQIRRDGDYLGVGRDVKAPEDVSDEDAEMILFAECLHSEVHWNIFDAAIRLLQKIHAKVAIYQTGGCCGGTLYDLGFWDELRDLLRKKATAMESLRDKQILFINPHCQEFMVVRLSQIDPRFKNINGKHFSQFLISAIKNGTLRVKKERRLRVAYHDPCHLSRGLGLSGPPREVLSLLEGVELIEMERHGVDTYCCGAGSGGRISAFPSFSRHIAEKRLREFKDTGADFLITACPYCKGIFEKTCLPGDGIMVKDLIEFVDERTV